MSFLGLLIPPQYKLAIEIAVLLAYTGATVNITYKYVNDTWRAEQAEQIKAASVLKDQLNAANSKLQETLAESTQQVEVTRRESLQKIDTLESSLRTAIANRGLRDPGRLQRRSCQTDTANQTGVSETAGQEEHPELSAGLTEFLLRKFTDADKVVVDREECYNKYEADIDAVNAYADQVEGLHK
jgi:hypothetical protein